MKKLGHSKSVFTHKSSVEVDGDIHMQSDAEVTDYSIKTLSEEIGVETVFAFSSDGTLVGMLIYGKEATTQIENSVPYYSVSKWSSNTKMLLLHFHAP